MDTSQKTEEERALAAGEETHEKIAVPAGVEEAGGRGSDPDPDPAADCSDEEEPCCSGADKKRRKGIKKLVTVYEGSFLQAEEELKTVGVCMVSLLVFVVPSVIVVIAGSSHLHECADRPMVPLLLISGGAIGLLKGLFGICCETRTVAVKPGGEASCPSIRCMAKMLSWCLVLWVATCSVIIYFDIDTCKADLYNVLLWTVLACYVGAVVLLICQCCSSDKEETKQIQNDVTTLTNTTVQERIEMVFG
ncbi:hypothetical protein Bbelb_150670 [Branchiostoma belcheri]|nr:hypothetical protein Bbelb_150670 [Branchiostoma belcheri]